MRNHNQLLGRVDGVDGIKTGYTRASGFNLVTSVRAATATSWRSCWAAVRAAQRDARMRELIEQPHRRGLDQGRRRSQRPPTAAPRAQQAGAHGIAAWPTGLNPLQRPCSPPPARRRCRSPSASRGHRNDRQRPGSSEPIKPVQVKTVAVKLVPPKQPAAVPAPKPSAPPRPSPRPKSRSRSPLRAASAQPRRNADARPRLAAAKEAIVPAAKAEEAPAPARHTIRAAAGSSRSAPSRTRPRPRSA